MRLSLKLFTLLALCAALNGCKSDPQKPMQEMPAIPVTAAAPVVRDVTTYVETIGTLRPSASVEVRPQVSGKVDRVLVGEGSQVEKGTLLFSIDELLYKSKMQEAQALLAIDQAGMQLAEKKLERYRDLAKRDLISQTEWDDLQTALAVAQAKVEMEKARLQSAQFDYENCLVKAPISGRVGKLDIHPGHLAAQSVPLASIVQNDPLTVEFHLTEKEYAKTNSWHRPIQLTLFCSDQKCHEGGITFLDSHFEGGLLLVRGTVPNAEQALRPGQSVRVRIPVAVAEQALLIPQKAIRYNQQGPYVYVIKEDKTVEMRALVVGDELESDQLVLEGLTAAEQIILDGHLRLSPGAKVDVQP
jgi:multidrug efflux system membrane fusion protein